MIERASGEARNFRIIKPNKHQTGQTTNELWSDALALLPPQPMSIYVESDHVSTKLAVLAYPPNLPLCLPLKAPSSVSHNLQTTSCPEFKRRLMQRKQYTVEDIYLHGWLEQNKSTWKSEPHSNGTQISKCFFPEQQKNNNNRQFLKNKQSLNIGQSSTTAATNSWWTVQHCLAAESAVLRFGTFKQSSHCSFVNEWKR